MTNRTMASYNTDTDRAGVLAVVDIVDALLISLKCHAARRGIAGDLAQTTPPKWPSGAGPYLSGGIGMHTNTAIAALTVPSIGAAIEQRDARFALLFGIGLHFTLLYVPDPASVFHSPPLRRCLATPFLSEQHVIGTRNCEMLNDWRRVTPGRIRYSTDAPHLREARLSSFARSFALNRRRGETSALLLRSTEQSSVNLETEPHSVRFVVPALVQSSSHNNPDEHDTTHGYDSDTMEIRNRIYFSWAVGAAIRSDWRHSGLAFHWLPLRSRHVGVVVSWSSRYCDSSLRSVAHQPTAPREVGFTMYSWVQCSIDRCCTSTSRNGSRHRCEPRTRNQASTMLRQQLTNDLRACIVQRGVTSAAGLFQRLTCTRTRKTKATGKEKQTRARPKTALHSTLPRSPSVGVIVSSTARSLETKQVAQRNRNCIRLGPGVISGNPGKPKLGRPFEPRSSQMPNVSSTFFPLPAEKRGSYKGYTGTPYKSTIASTRRALYWRAVFSYTTNWNHDQQTDIGTNPNFARKTTGRCRQSSETRLQKNIPLPAASPFEKGAYRSGGGVEEGGGASDLMQMAIFLCGPVDAQDTKHRGAAVAERLACSPPTKEILVQSHVGIVSDDAVDQRILSGISRFPRSILTSITPIGSQTTLLRAVQISSVAKLRDSVLMAP
ncbi:hypothetical protein PR048_030048 [Dryococelus australis]|uniref:Uncharacterized protein n=1 Tax=Dryococelus australis TaxID=614101 RepID=A0ABQ9G7V2_9NEOP|nr:hypothetical protein PR048_030048 [Dryococelus australis]